MARTLDNVAQAVGGQLLGADCTFTNVSTDTRTLTAGALFVALKGPHFDGHRFLQDAAGKGAVGGARRNAGGIDIEPSYRCGQPPRLRTVGGRVAGGFLTVNGRHHRQQWQNDHQGIGDFDPWGVGNGARDPRQLQQRYRAAAHVA